MEDKFIKIKDTILNTKNIVSICKDEWVHNYLIEVKLNNEHTRYISFGRDREKRDKELENAYKRLGGE